jgi:PBP1b-binding outer membrane lipoprotein LpoB
MKKMMFVIMLVGMAMMFGCSEQEVIPAEEVAVEKSDYHETPEGGLSDREGPLGQ